jgi:hypothetical protein
MEILNMTWVNLLRMQFIEILEFYDENLERFNYKELKKAYDALLSVKSVEEFKQWRKLLKDYGLSFAEVDDINSSNNMLGILDDHAEGANDWILDVFIRWKQSFNPEKWMEVESWNCELVEILLKATLREEDVHIVIFPCGKPETKRWAAIGQDANRLFEIFGWQTGCVETASEPVSWMFINKYGLEVLHQSGYSVQIRDFGEFDILSTSFEEDSIASLQQFIDYLRMMDSITQEQVNFLKKIRPIIFRNSGYWELTHGNLVFGKDCVVAEFDNGKKVTLAQGKNWRMHELFRPMFLEMGAELGEA